MGIGKRIREAVDALGLTLKQASDVCEIPYSSLQNWAGGHRDPRPEALINIGSRLGISIDWLLTGEGPMRRVAESQGRHEVEINPREQALLTLWRDLDEGAQREIQHVAEEKKRLNELEQRVSELEAVVASGKKMA